VFIITEKARVRESRCRFYEGQIVNKLEHVETSQTAYKKSLTVISFLLRICFASMMCSLQLVSLQTLLVFLREEES
jgi:hypothetical protein